MSDEYRFNGAGGTPGGVIEFFVGLGMSLAGGYLLTNQVRVASSFWTLWGYNTFGLSLIPLIFGIGILFFNGKSIPNFSLPSCRQIYSIFDRRARSAAPL